MRLKEKPRLAPPLGKATPQNCFHWVTDKPQPKAKGLQKLCLAQIKGEWGIKCFHLGTSSWVFSLAHE